MLNSTLTTIETIVKADPTIDPELAERIAEMCKSPKRPGPRVTVKRAAEVLGVHPRTIGRYVRDGKIRAIKTSRRRIRYDLNQIEAIALEGVE